MKSLYLTLLTCLLFANLSFTQEIGPRHSLKYGFGTAYLKSGKFTGSTQQLEYQFRPLNRLSLSLGLGKTNAQKLVEENFEKKTLAYQLDAGLYFSLVQNKVNALKIGGSGSLRYAESQLQAGDSIFTEGSIFSRIQNQPENRHYGFTTALEYEVYIAKYITLGSRFTYGQYQNGDKTYNWGLNLGFRF